jgi:hypothetical protein
MIVLLVKINQSGQFADHLLSFPREGHFIISSLAQQYGALQVALEHRFYGQSVPSGDSSTSHLQYLSSDQALEDLVTFHAFLEGKYGKAKWIVFGGSYSGSLSAWARLKSVHSSTANTGYEFLR